MATDLKYANQADLKNYFNNFGDFDQKVQIFPTLTSGNLHLFRDCGYVETLFINGEEIAAAQSTSGAVDTNGEWFYNSATNQLEYYNSSYSATSVLEQVFEAGVDFATFIDQQLVNSSLELNNLLDARFETPIPKSHQIKHSADGSANQHDLTSEYDPIIKKATCYIAAANLIRSRDPISEVADKYMSLITNPERTGIVDRLNDGHIKLSYEVDRNDKKGSVRQITKTGTMDIVDVSGTFQGGHNGYDCLRLTCTQAGVYGTAEITVQSYGNDKIFGLTNTASVVTGGYDYFDGMGGLGVRFQGDTLAAGDVFEIEAFTSFQEDTNSKVNNIQAYRVDFRRTQ